MSKANVTTCDACGETTTVDCPYIGGGWYKIDVSGYSREGDKPKIERKLDACSPACVADAMRQEGDRISPARVVSPAAPAALDGPVDPVARASSSLHEVEGIKANTFAHEADVEAKPSADCAFDPRATVEKRKVVATELPSRLAEEGGGQSRAHVLAPRGGRRRGPLAGVRTRETAGASAHATLHGHDSGCAHGQRGTDRFGSVERRRGGGARWMTARRASRRSDAVADAGTRAAPTSSCRPRGVTTSNGCGRSAASCGWNRRSFVARKIVSRARPRRATRSGATRARVIWHASSRVRSLGDVAMFAYRGRDDRGDWTMDAIKVRKIPVKAGDVFGLSTYVLVVESTDGTARATVRNAHTGRRTKVQILRLQMEYPRASERGSIAAIRMLQRLDARTATRRAKDGERPRR